MLEYLKWAFYASLFTAAVVTADTLIRNTEQMALCSSLWNQGVTAYLVEGIFTKKCMSTQIDLSLERALLHE